jgi:hypothetical protein
VPWSREQRPGPTGRRRSNSRLGGQLSVRVALPVRRRSCLRRWEATSAITRRAIPTRVSASDEAELRINAAGLLQRARFKDHQHAVSHRYVRLLVGEPLRNDRDVFAAGQQTGLRHRNADLCSQDRPEILGGGVERERRPRVKVEASDSDAADNHRQRKRTLHAHVPNTIREPAEPLIDGNQVDADRSILGRRLQTWAFLHLVPSEGDSDDNTVDHRFGLWPSLDDKRDAAGVASRHAPLARLKMPSRSRFKLGPSPSNVTLKVTLGRHEARRGSQTSSRRRTISSGVIRPSSPRVSRTTQGVVENPAS